MPLSVECQECGTKYNVPDKLAGKRAKCKKCGATMSIPEPDAPIGFAPDSEEDPLAALQDLARQSGEAEAAPEPAPAPRRRDTAAGSVAGGRVGGAPAGWTPESVIVERAPSSAASGPSAAGSGRWAKTNRRPLDPDVLAKLLVFFFIAALGAVGFYIHQRLSGVAPARGVAAWWTWVGTFLVLCFALVAPLAMIGPAVAAKLFRQILPSGAYLRTVAVATLPLTLLAVVALGVVAGVVSNSLIWTLMAVLVPLTIALSWYLFEMSAAAAVVGWVLGVVPYVVGLFLALAIAKPITNAVKGDAGVQGGRTAVAANAGPFASWLPSVNSAAKPAEKTATDIAADNQATKQAPPKPPTETEQKRNQSADKLRQIYAAINTHLAATNRNWPLDLASLQRDQGLDAQVLTSPFGPAFAAGDYVYKPYVPETVAGPAVVLAYDNAELSNGEGANVLFGTGEVRWLAIDAVEAALAQSESIRVAAAQQREQALAMRLQQPQQSPTSPTVVDGGAGQGGGTGPGAQRLVARGDVADQIKAGAQGYVAEAQEVAVRRGTEQLIRAVTPASAVAVLVRGTQGDTVEVFDGKAAEPVAVADFQTDPQFRNNPGAYALSPDGKLLARLTSWPKLEASVYSFEKKAEAKSIELDTVNGEPTLVGFMAPDRFIIRWQLGGEHGLQVWNARTGERGRQLVLSRVDPPPAPGSEAISPDGRTYAIVNRAAPANAPRGRAAAAQQGLQVLLYDVIGGGTQPRRFQVPVLGNQPGVSPAGLAFSPDKQRLALLLVDNQGRAVVLQWNMATGKPLPEHALPEKVDLPRVGFGRVRGLDYVADGRALLVAGRTLLNPDTGATLAVLDAGKVHGQAVTDDATVHLAHGDFAQLEGVAVITLNEGKLPEKPGTPNRAVAAPAR